MKKTRKSYKTRQEVKSPHRINEKIYAKTVRLVGDNVEMQIYSTYEARKMASDLELDLVEINAKSDPPVCKIIDYSKFLYEYRKKEKLNKKNSATTKVKEIKFGPNTDDHDFNFKLEHAKKFIESGHKVKVFVHFKGRQIVHKELGEILILKLLSALEDSIKVEQLPKLEGRRMIAILSPKKK